MPPFDTFDPKVCDLPKHQHRRRASCEIALLLQDRLIDLHPTPLPSHKVRNQNKKLEIQCLRRLANTPPVTAKNIRPDESDLVWRTVALCLTPIAGSLYRAADRFDCDN